MKHFFIVNPVAGNKNIKAEITNALSSANLSEDIEIYETKDVLDATRFVKEKCAELKDEEIRFYACGGDGTLNEVVSGAVNCKNASVGCYPGGSGNDYVKYYGIENKDKFLDVNALINGKSEPVDVAETQGKYSVNVLGMGFDVDVLRTMVKLRRNKFIGGGKRAYYSGIARAFFKAMKTPYEVYADGEKLNSKYMLLCTLSNGRYVGSSFKCAPRSLNNDGKLEVCLVKPISRLLFIKVIKEYVNGTHIDNPDIAKYIEYRRAEEVKITSPEKVYLSLDGEILECENTVVKILKGAVNFIVPEGI